MTREATEAEAGAEVTERLPPEEVAPPEPPPPPAPPRVVVPRWVQLVLLPISLLALWAVANAAGTVLLIFITAGLIALFLNPIVQVFEKAKIPRSLAVLLTYLLFLAIAAGIIALLITPVSNQIQTFQKDVPSLVKQANHRLADLQNYLDKHHINIHIKKQGQTALETLQKGVVKRSGAIVSFTRDLVATIVQTIFALVLIVVLSVYFLLYGGQIGRLVRRTMPPGNGTPEDDYPVLAQKAVYQYVRGQLLFSLAMGTGAGVALYIFGLVGIFPDGKTYALFFGVFYALMELIPYVGPILGAAPPVLVGLFQNPLTALWLVLLFIGIQQIEGHIVAPQIFGLSLRLNPILIIFALLFGFEVYGILGALLSLPIAAVLRETVVYLRRHLVLEPWHTPSVNELTGLGLLARRTACPACGERAHSGDAFCRACGEPLARPRDPPG
jgi:predicted PurR-regulated permease PerM